MKANIITNIPGPRSLELKEKREKSVAKGHGSVCGVFIKKALGSNLIDVDGNIFIDFAGGIRDHECGAFASQSNSGNGKSITSIYPPLFYGCSL